MPPLRECSPLSDFPFIVSERALELLRAALSSWHPDISPSITIILPILYARIDIESVFVASAVNKLDTSTGLVLELTSSIADCTLVLDKPDVLLLYIISEALRELPPPDNLAA